MLPKTNERSKNGITQKDHDFRYGANLFMLGELQDEERNERYKQSLSDREMPVLNCFKCEKA